MYALILTTLMLPHALPYTVEYETYSSMQKCEDAAFLLEQKLEKQTKENPKFNYIITCREKTE